MSQRVSRGFRNAVKRSMRLALEAGQRFGINITPRHFYSEVPDIREMRRTSGWRRPYALGAIRGAVLDDQLAFVRDCCERYREELHRHQVHEDACARNGEPGYGPIEAEFLYCFVRRHRPDRVIQVGAGVSTAVILAAADDEGYAPNLTCIDPFPTRFLKGLADEGRVALISTRAQDVEPAEMTSVGAGDLLFVDSTHTIRPGSDVCRIILEVLPRLGAGAWVHFHDIYLPYDYSPELLTTDLFFSRETVLLQAFLTNNMRFTVRAALSLLHHGRPEALREILPGYSPAPFEDGLRVGEGHFPSALWMSVEP